jgi:hypothetical protein
VFIPALVDYIGSIGIAVIPTRYRGVKRDKIRDKNAS